ncbi:formate/nitrite transporter family protein [Staphylococcus haemolyticus]|uniref:formate/nitrite transporter family protein n=1 Tax=Staphylococcus haemolyticus TaxID=1283 RepID=UPI001F0BF21F|nr:formate/nitrite transporter family protein [Staphylococcus haemolyticus]MCH4382311.1 formate/nitrite transporter family protein [Staphylococcus haemolyticus]
MLKNNKTVEDTHATRDIVEAAVGQVQTKEIMATKTPGRYALKAIMSGFLLAIVTVFMLAIKTQFAGTNEGLVNLLGAIAFSLALVLIVLTNSELLTSNFMYLTVGWYYRAITINEMLFIFLFCFIGNIIGGFILLFLMKGTHIMTPEMIASLSKTVHMKTVESTWLNILVKAIFCNFFINIGIYVSMLFKEGLARAFFIAAGVVVFVFMGYEHVVFNAGLYAGMVFYNIDVLSWLGVIKNIVFALIGNYIGGGIFIGLVYAYLNGSRDSIKAK